MWLSFSCYKKTQSVRNSEKYVFYCFPLVFGLKPDLISDIEAVVGNTFGFAAPYGN